MAPLPAMEARPDERSPWRLGIPAAVLLSAAAFGAAAAPPPDHPSPADALRLIQPGGDAPAEPEHTGVVLDAIDANEYTYIEVDEGGRNFWIATAHMPVVRGDLVRFAGGVTMAPFYSKLLQRNFSSVMFVGEVTTAGRK